jgi:hypothetical protein
VGEGARRRTIEEVPGGPPNGSSPRPLIVTQIASPSPGGSGGSGNGGPSGRGSGQVGPSGRGSGNGGPARAPRGRWLIAGLGIGLVLALAAVGVLAVEVAARAGTTLDAVLPQTIVHVDDPAAVTTAAPTTTAPRPELAALKGRPRSPVQADEASCTPPLKAGRLRPQAPADWTGRSPASTSPPPTDAEVRAEVTQVMRRRFRRAEPERAVRDAMLLYESPRLREITGDEVVLRAALAELKGTLGEPVLRFALTTDRPLSLRFGRPVLPNASGEAVGDGYHLSIMVHEEYRNESPALVAPVVFHELMHQGGQSQQPEEIVNNVLDRRLTIELLRDAPAAFTRRSRLIDSARIGVVAQLNTRVGTELAVERSETTNVLPGFEGPPAPSFVAVLLSEESDGADVGVASYYSRLADAPTKGNPTLVEVLRMVAPDADVPDDQLFDRSAVTLLDRHPGVGLCDQLVAAEVLGLLPRGTPAQRLARTYVNSLTSA